MNSNRTWWVLLGLVWVLVGGFLLVRGDMRERAARWFSSFNGAAARRFGARGRGLAFYSSIRLARLWFIAVAGGLVVIGLLTILGVGGRG